MFGTELLVITSPGCRQCRAMRPELDRLIATYSDQMHIDEIDASAESERVARLGVKATPTLIIRRAGVEHSRVVGRLSNDDLRRFFTTPETFKPSPVDAVVRGSAGVALLGIGLGLDVSILVGLGLALIAWMAATVWASRR